MTAPLTPEYRALVAFLTPAARRAHEHRLWVQKWGPDTSPCERCETVPGVRYSGDFEGQFMCEDCADRYERWNDDSGGW